MYIWVFIRNIYDYDINFIKSVDLPNKIKEGWGITADDSNKTIISDGSNHLYKTTINNSTHEFEVIQTYDIKFENNT